MPEEEDLGLLHSGTLRQVVLFRVSGLRGLRLFQPNLGSLSKRARHRFAQAL